MFGTQVLADTDGETSLLADSERFLGRALGVFPPGIVDLKDDLEDAYAGPVIKEIAEKMRVAASAAATAEK